jgi:hypothetical protein
MEINITGGTAYAIFANSPGQQVGAEWNFEAQFVADIPMLD